MPRELRLALEQSLLPVFAVLLALATVNLVVTSRFPDLRVAPRTPTNPWSVNREGCVCARQLVRKKIHFFMRLKLVALGSAALQARPEGCPLLVDGLHPGPLSAAEFALGDAPGGIAGLDRLDWRPIRVPGSWAESRYSGPRVRLVPVPVHAVACGGCTPAGVHVLADPRRGRDLPRWRSHRRDGRVSTPVRQGHAPGAPVRASGDAHERPGPARTRRARLRRRPATRRPHGRAVSRHGIGRVTGADDLRIAARPRGRGDLLAGRLRAHRVPSRAAAARVPVLLPPDDRRRGLHLVLPVAGWSRFSISLSFIFRANFALAFALSALFTLFFHYFFSSSGSAVDACRSRDPGRRPPWRRAPCRESTISTPSCRSAMRRWS